ncbi:MAG: SEC-C metal-binding domain-containing protein [Solirubrobacteraceae bacterium]
MDPEWDPAENEVESTTNELRAALRTDRFEDARALVERIADEPDTPRWLVTSMLEEIGLSLARARRHDDSIATFERALELEWDVVPHGRCEIARVLLLAARHQEADSLWNELRQNDLGGVWTLNAGGLAYHEVGRDEEAVQWLGEGLRVALDRNDPERVVDQMSDARRLSLQRLQLELDEIEREVEIFRAQAKEREQQRISELRAASHRTDILVRGRPATIAWLTEVDDRAARERWAEWVDSLNDDAPFDERRARMERRLREVRSGGDGPLVVVTIDPDHYATWCEEEGYEPADRRSRSSYVEAERESGGGRRWPPARNEPCWCGSKHKYKRCCGALSTHAAIPSAA